MDRLEMEAGEGECGCAGARACCRAGELLSLLSRGKRDGIKWSRRLKHGKGQAGTPALGLVLG